MTHLERPGDAGELRQSLRGKRDRHARSFGIIGVPGRVGGLQPVPATIGQPDLRPRGPGRLRQHPGQMWQHLLGRHGGADLVRERGQGLVGGGPPPVHQAVRQPLNALTDRLERHRDDRRREDRQPEARPALPVGGLADPDHQRDVDRGDEDGQRQVDDGLVDDDVDVVQAPGEDRDAHRDRDGREGERDDAVHVVVEGLGRRPQLQQGADDDAGHHHARRVGEPLDLLAHHGLGPAEPHDERDAGQHAARDGQHLPRLQVTQHPARGARRREGFAAWRSGSRAGPRVCPMVNSSQPAPISQPAQRHRCDGSEPAGGLASGGRRPGMLGAGRVAAGEGRQHGQRPDQPPGQGAVPGAGRD